MQADTQRKPSVSSKCQLSVLGICLIPLIYQPNKMARNLTQFALREWTPDIGDLSK